MSDHMIPQAQRNRYYGFIAEEIQDGELKGHWTATVFMANEKVSDEPGVPDTPMPMKIKSVPFKPLWAGPHAALQRALAELGVTQEEWVERGCVLKFSERGEPGLITFKRPE